MEQHKQMIIEYSYSTNSLYTSETATNHKELVKEALEKLGHLRQSDLNGFDLRGADLRGADLSSANLRGADLSSANLSSANLRGANLSSANLSSANLSSANLSSANLSSANLRGADLSSANLSSANLRGANLDVTKLKDLMLERWIVPEEGSFVAWKKLRIANPNGSGDLEVIAKLEIPDGVRRTSNLISRKCRAESVKTLELRLADGTPVSATSARSFTRIYPAAIYTVGETTVADTYDDNLLQDCTHGIHFFITRQEAVNWNG